MNWKSEDGIFNQKQFQEDSHFKLRIDKINGNELGNTILSRHGYNCRLNCPSETISLDAM